jgi:transcriptional regulator with XRE-family HTH domain
MDLADRFRALRKELGLTQEELAPHLGMVRTDVVHVERGRRRLSGHEKRKRVAAGLGLPVSLFDAYLDGEVALDVVAEISRRKFSGGAS